jgi:DNA-binding IclR family transcriptional regulator
MSTAQFAGTSGLPRSSVYQAVRRLENAGLVARRGGMLYPGANLIQLGFAAFGLAPLHGPAAALAKLLHDETGGCVTLLVDKVLLLRVGSDGRAAIEFEAAIGDKACLTLTLPQIPDRAERAADEEVFNRVASTLNALLAQAGHFP